MVSENHSVPVVCCAKHFVKNELRYRKIYIGLRKNYVRYRINEVRFRLEYIRRV